MGARVESAAGAESATKASALDASATSPMPASPGIGDNNNNLQQLLVELIRSLSSLCAPETPFSGAPHVPANPADKPAVNRLLDPTLTIIKRLYLHLAARHDRFGKVTPATASTVLREAEIIAGTTDPS